MMKLDTVADDIKRHHKDLPAREYENSSQRHRIELSRKMVEFVLDDCKKKRLTIVEYGCGTGDIIGPFSEKHDCSGYEINKRAVLKARRRFPKLAVYEADIEGTMEPKEADLVIFCEILEHLQYPLVVYPELAECSKYVLISHPLDESPDEINYNPEHYWSFDLEDFHDWFNMSGHKLIKIESTKVGVNKVLFGVGKK